MKNSENKIEKAIEQYRNLAIQHADGIEAGDNKKTNKAYDKLNKLFITLKRNNSITEKVLTILLRSDDFRVRGWAAAHCLALKIHVNEAEKILEEVANRYDLPLLSHEAKMTLEVWKKQGYLNF